MKSIMVINSKGGSGKTTIAVNLSAYCAQRGYETTIIDLDPQESSTQWLKERPLSKPKILGFKNIKKTEGKDDQVFTNSHFETFHSWKTLNASYITFNTLNMLME